MVDNMADEYTAQEKAAWVTWELANGGELTPRDLITRFNITHQAASYILYGLSRVTPIHRTDEGRWRRFNHTT